MTSSGTYTFDPAVSDVVLNAYGRIQIRNPAITAQHLQDAAMEGQLMLVEWSNKQPLLWKSELISHAATQGTATYTLPIRVVMILLAYVSTGSGTSQVDRVLGPLSTTEYAAIPNKNNQAPPTAFWFDRQITPQIVLWQVPDGGGPYTLYMRCVSRVQDVAITGGQTLDAPYRFLDAFAAGLAHRLARIHKPELEDKRKMDAMEAWQIAATQDVENVQMSISPLLGSYYR